MAYGQKNYNDLVGNSKWRISQIGCFLVSFSNLLQRFGNDINPASLNNEFRNKGVYLPDSSEGGVRDLLAYTSVTAFDPSVVMTGKGTGKPPHNDCIVKFHYVSNGGATNTHFCLVADASKGLIVDSYDGVVKSWNVYGGPIEWASYVDNTPNAAPQVVTPAVTAPAFNGTEITILPGWGLSAAAKAAGFSDFDTPARWQAIAQLNGSTDWQVFNKSLKAGQRIKVNAPAPPAPIVTPSNGVEWVEVQAGWGLQKIAQAAGFADYTSTNRWGDIAALNGSNNWGDFNKKLVKGQQVRVRPAPAPVAPTPTPAVPAPVETPTVEVVPVTVKPPTSYKDSYKPDNTVYIATQSMIIKDLDGLQRDIQLVENQKVTADGQFVKDGVTYVRSKYHAEKGIWYGVPLSVLTTSDKKRYTGPLITDEDDKLFEELYNIDMAKEAKELMNNLSSREKVVAFIGKVQGAFLRVISKFSFNKKKEV